MASRAKGRVGETRLPIPEHMVDISATGAIARLLHRAIISNDKGETRARCFSTTNGATATRDN